ncbi:hypothetical protein ACH5RR_008954 [Cinchona calisaya]|uniref:CDT1 Geminin-binding domain-containing protein n=1 Tax=Cinchona calisaya TaxID=153742 RepID=A0ABD3AD22_9GENT
MTLESTSPARYHFLLFYPVGFNNFIYCFINSKHQMIVKFNSKSMEQTDLGKCQQDILDSEGQSTLPGAEKSSYASPNPSERRGNFGRQHLKSDFASVTPEKSSETSYTKCNKEEDQFPKKYRTVLEFLDRMTCSLRLLRLCKKCPTFTNICSQVETLAGRKFEYKHLAKIKYMLHEAVQIEKILVHDPETMCMKPEIKVSFLFDVVEGHHEESAFIALRHLFASRLINFLNSHPEACDIPEAVLPEPFNKEVTTIKADQLPVHALTSIETETLSSSHFCPSFSRCFSERAIGEETDETRLTASHVTCSPINCEFVAEQESERHRISPDSCSKPTNYRNSANTFPLYVDSITCRSTPMKVVSESDNFVLETPAQSAPKRSLSTCEGKNRTVINQIGMSCDQTAKRSLDFSRFDDEESSLNFSSYEIEQNNISQNTSAKVEIEGTSAKSYVTATSTTPCQDKASNRFCEKGHMSNQSCLPAHVQKSICLSDLAFSVQRIFRSRNGHSITKEELIHRIIMDNCDIDENSNIEEQIELLEKLVPDWICRRLAPSGDLLYNVKKVPDLNSVCERVISI